MSPHSTKPSRLGVWLSTGSSGYDPQRLIHWAWWQRPVISKFYQQEDKESKVTLNFIGEPGHLRPCPVSKLKLSVTEYKDIIITRCDRYDG